MSKAIVSKESKKSETGSPIEIKSEKSSLLHTDSGSDMILGVEGEQFDTFNKHLADQWGKRILEL